MTILRILFEIRRKINSARFFSGAALCAAPVEGHARVSPFPLYHMFFLSDHLMIIFRPCSSFSGHLFRSPLFNPSGGLGQGVRSSACPDLKQELHPSAAQSNREERFAGLVIPVLADVPLLVPCDRKAGEISHVILILLSLLVKNGRGAS